MKQHNLFGEEFKIDDDNKYSKKIQAPVYEPKNVKPHELELFDNIKTARLINEIENSDLTEYEKRFLILAAHRHTVFNYEKIADYYAHSPKHVQDLMEKSALIIIDFERAIQLGYVQICEEIRNQYLESYE